jgi:AcrR family transcriptional regulator
MTADDLDATDCGTTEVGTKLRLNATDRRSQILAAAMELFAERGFHDARTRELADRAGVSEALLYRHFPTKEALFQAILDLVALEEHVRAMEEETEGIPPRAALAALAERVLTQVRDNPCVFRVVFFSVLETPHLASEFYQRFLSRILSLETRLFERAFASGSAGPASRVDPRVVARSFHGSLLFINLAGAVIRIEPLPEDPKAMAEAIVSLYLPEDAA